MTNLKVGHEYQAHKIQTGKKKSGKPWEKITVKSQGPRQPVIIVFVDNAPSNLDYTGIFKVESINAVTVINTKDKNGNWHQNGSVVVNANISPGNSLKFMDFGEPKPQQRRSQKIYPGLEDFFNGG